MSFECAVGIQALLDCEMIVTIPREQKYIPSSLQTLPKSFMEVLNQQHRPYLEDVLEWWRRPLFHFVDEEIQGRRLPLPRVINLAETCIDCLETQDENVMTFAHGRKRLFLGGPHTLIFDRTLCWYSYLFYNRTEMLNQTFARVRFKEPYYALAKKISDSVGPFYGAHVRLSDFTPQFYSLTKEEITRGLEILRQRHSLPLIIASDDPFHPHLSNLAGTCLSAEQVILSDFCSEFKSLPFNDATALAIVSNLLLGYSTDFIGTPGSTFTGHIHRQLQLKNQCHWRFFCYPEGATLDSPPPRWADGKIRACARNWWREWPACSLGSGDPKNAN
jgi:hypothetical protein